MDERDRTVHTFRFPPTRGRRDAQPERRTCPLSTGGGAWIHEQLLNGGRSPLEGGFDRIRASIDNFITALSHSLPFECGRGRRRSHPAAIASAQDQLKPSFHIELLVDIVEVNFHRPFG